MSLTADDIRRIALEEFAALTRHTPASLSGKFYMNLIEDGAPLDPEIRISLRFAGKRKASGTFSNDIFEMDEEAFADAVRPLARELLASA
jgi:hypothetical protein